MKTRQQEITEMLKENQQLDSGGPGQSQNFRHQSTYLKVLQAGAVIESKAQPAGVQPKRKANTFHAKIQNSIRIQMRRSREINQRY